MEFDNKLNSVLSENTRPSEGIWYYIYLKPEWGFLHWKFTEYPTAYDHPKVWVDYVLPVLVKHYKLTDDQTDKLKPLYYSMPRGRINHLAFLPGHSSSGRWVVAHGRDFPLDEDSELKNIVNAFNLSGLVLWKMVDFEVADHEKMSKRHMEDIQKIIGPVPY